MAKASRYGWGERRDFSSLGELAKWSAHNWRHGGLMYFHTDRPRELLFFYFHRKKNRRGNCFLMYLGSMRRLRHPQGSHRPQLVNGKVSGSQLVSGWIQQTSLTWAPRSIYKNIFPSCCSPDPFFFRCCSPASEKVHWGERENVWSGELKGRNRHEQHLVEQQLSIMVPCSPLEILLIFSYVLSIW